MGENSGIEWTHHTFNPVTGCQKVGPGCDHCYAEGWAKRSGLVKWGPGEERRKTSAAYWRQPLKWDRDAAAAGERRRVFCASLADVFDNAWPEGVRADLWALIKATPHLDWMLLTKRPGNIARMLPADWARGYPNVWLGCTVVNQSEADRDIPKLLAVPAVVRFLSMEPLLGPVDLGGPVRSALFSGKIAIDGGDGTKPISLVILGGESGPGARPMHPDWVRGLRDQCIAAGVAFHFKQWGDWQAALDREREDPDWRADYSRRFADGGKTKWLNLEGGCGFHGERFHVMCRVGKKAAGRLLDGRTWDQMPEASHV